MTAAIQTWQLTKSYRGRPRGMPRSTVTMWFTPGSWRSADVWARMLPYWSDVLFPQVLSGETPLVVGHGNSLRALVMYLERLRPAEIERLDIPTAVPMRYRLDRLRNPIVEPGGRYLDPAGPGRQWVDDAGEPGCRRCEIRAKAPSPDGGRLADWERTCSTCAARLPYSCWSSHCAGHACGSVPAGGAPPG